MTTRGRRTIILAELEKLGIDLKDAAKIDSKKLLEAERRVRAGKLATHDLEITIETEKTEIEAEAEANIISTDIEIETTSEAEAEAEPALVDETKIASDTEAEITKKKRVKKKTSE